MPSPSVRIDRLEREMSAGPPQAELDAQRCAAALDHGARAASLLDLPPPPTTMVVP